MNKTSGLGRGLGSLIPNKKISGTAVAVGDDQLLETGERISLLPVEKISPNPHQPRKVFNDEDLQELIASIREHGIIQPVIVSQKSPDQWELVAGERRLRASKSLGLPTIPAIVRGFSEQKKMEIALIENIQRKNLNPMESARAYRKLMDEFNLTIADLSRKTGKADTTINNSLRLLKADQQIQDAVEQEKITEGHAKILVNLPVEEQRRILDRILIDKINVHETERAAREVAIRNHTRKVNYDPELKAKEDALRAALGTKVEIKKRGSSGQIIVKFFSEEELSQIVQNIAGMD